MTSKTARKLNKKSKIALICVSAAILVSVVLWLYLELTFDFKQMKVVSTDEKRILTEMPEIELTAAEIGLSDTVFDVPIIRQTLEKGDTVEIPFEDVSAHISPAVPDNAEIILVETLLNGVRIVYELNGNDHYLSYAPSAITKIISVSELYAEGPDSSGEIREIYTTKAMYFAEYDSSSGSVYYSKEEPRHVWFGFLSEKRMLSTSLAQY